MFDKGESPKDLTDFERKLTTIILHKSREGKSPSLKQLEWWTGRSPEQIKKTLKDLMRREWIAVKNEKFIVLKVLLNLKKRNLCMYGIVILNYYSIHFLALK